MSIATDSITTSAAPTNATSAPSDQTASGAVTGTVVTIHMVREKNGPAESLEKAEVTTEYGIKGDWRSHSNTSRQLTLIDEQALLATGQALGITVPPGASRRQVAVRGLALNHTVGKTLRAGELLLLITGLCDPCTNMESKIGPGARDALSNRGGINARVLRGGCLRPGDTVQVMD